MIETFKIFFSRDRMEKSVLSLMGLDEKFMITDPCFSIFDSFKDYLFLKNNIKKDTKCRAKKDKKWAKISNNRSYHHNNI